jgi:hypothetical protein
MSLVLNSGNVLNGDRSAVSNEPPVPVPYDKDDDAVNEYEALVK